MQFLPCFYNRRSAGGERETVRQESERRGPGGHHNGTLMGGRLGQGSLLERGAQRGLGTMKREQHA